MTKSRPSIAGASAQARYRAQLAETRTHRLIVRTLLTVAAGVLMWLAISWKAALLTAAVVATADWL